MSEWTHSMCAKCWGERNPNRRATVVIKAPTESCCFCGIHHSSGIYVRHNPAELTCTHEENS